jgi:hypothetical protein
MEIDKFPSLSAMIAQRCRKKTIISNKKLLPVEQLGSLD